MGQQRVLIPKNTLERAGTLSPLEAEAEVCIQQGHFPTPKQELTLLERDFLLVLRLGAQIGI